jgi:ribonuclease Z
VPLLKLVFLGTGGAVPRPGSALPAIYLEDWLGNRVLLDAGEGAQYRLLEAGVSPASLTLIAVTHMHEDHVLGLPGTLATASLFGGRPVVLAPRSAHDVLRGLGVEVMERYESRRFRVSCVRTCHTIDACGWLLEWDAGIKFSRDKIAELPRWAVAALARGEAVEVGGRVIRQGDVVEGRQRRFKRLLYTGDTAPCPEMWSAVGEVDVLIHEAAFADDVSPRKAHREGHSTIVDAVEAARALRARVLVVTHVSARYPDKSRHKALARVVRPPPYVYVPDDMDALLISL